MPAQFSLYTLEVIVKAAFVEVLSSTVSPGMGTPITCPPSCFV